MASMMATLRNRMLGTAVRTLDSSSAPFTQRFVIRTTRQINTTARFLPRNPLPSKQLPSASKPKLPSQVFRRFFSKSRTRRNASPSSSAPKEDSSLSGRLKKLSREYGWSALGVYLMLSALDFPFCYLLVRTLGTDRIGRWEEVIVSHIAQLIPESVKLKWHEFRKTVKDTEKEYTGQEVVNDSVEMAGWGVEKAEAENKKDASVATQLALAYAIHKSFIFVRVPLTAAVTPKVVKVLRGWGWDIGKKTTKAAKAAKRAELQKPKL